jgi:hypothetical protein
MKTKPYFRGRRKRIDAPTHPFSPFDRISIEEAVSLITQEIRPEYEPWWKVRDKVAKRVKNALKAGRLNPDERGQLKFGDLSYWARRRSNWPKKLSHWPWHKVLEIKDDLSVKDSLTVNHTNYPATIEECHAEISVLKEDLAEAKRRELELGEENERLRPMAERYEEICEKNRINAGKPKDV